VASESDFADLTQPTERFDIVKLLNWSVNNAKTAKNGLARDRATT
jgi:hypothetical protein